MAVFQQTGVMCLGDILPDALMDQNTKALSINALQLDSRKITTGDAFIAMPGLTHDGRDYIEQALAAGASVVIAEADGLSLQHPLVVPVANLMSRLSAIAAAFYLHPSKKMHMIGITGTNGKTSCSFLLAQLFAALGEPAAVMGTLGCGLMGSNNTALTTTGMTTPDAIATQAQLAEILEQGAKSVAMEVSSHSLEQGRVAAVDFETAIFTNLSRDHLDYHETMQAYGAAKARLFKQPGLHNAVINLDDPFAPSIIESINCEVNIVTFGASSAADVWLADVVKTSNITHATLHSPWGEGELQTSLMGDFNLANLMAVISAACLKGYRLADVLKHIPDLSAVKGRMERIAINSRAPNVIVDFAHTPDALAEALSALKSNLQGKLWVVFGCGGDRDKGKRQLMGEIADKLADQVVLTSDNPRSEDPQQILNDIALGVAKPVIINSREEAIYQAISKAGINDCILIAGKGHEDYQLIAGIKHPFSDQACAKAALKKHWEGK